MKIKFNTPQSSFTYPSVGHIPGNVFFTGNVEGRTESYFMMIADGFIAFTLNHKTDEFAGKFIGFRNIDTDSYLTCSNVKLYNVELTLTPYKET